MTEKRDEIVSQNVKEFSQFLDFYKHLAADLPYYGGDRKVLYTMDFNLLYPFLFDNKNKAHPVSDLVGRNIFTLLSTYHSSAGFVPVLSVPSLLELFDVISHQVEDLNRLLNSSNSMRSVWTSMRQEFIERGTLSDDRSLSLRESIRTLRILERNEKFADLQRMLDQDQITTLRDHVDSSIFSTDEFRKLFDEIYGRMRPSRSLRDKREFDDKVFHYTVDSWNLAAAALSNHYNNFEIDHVCRPGISQFLPSGLQTRRSRHPYVVLIRLYSLFMSPSEGDILQESESFTRRGVVEVNECINIMSDISSINQLSVIERNHIDHVYNKYIRHLLMDFEKIDQSKKWKDVRKAIDEEVDGRYISITTEEGLRERFKADAENLKNSARKIIESRPQLFDDRLLGEYNLDNNPRVQKIMKKLDL